MRKWCFLLLVLIGSTGFALAQQPDEEGSLVKWMSIKEAMVKMETQPRPMLMDFYTGWCGWCKHMMKTTYASPDLAAYINQNFYPVKFDAEGKDTVNFLGTTYMPVSDKPRTTHPLAAKLLQNNLMYPSTMFFNNYDKTKKEFVFNMKAQGYLESQKLEPILIFTLENVFRSTNYEDFKVQFEKTFRDPKIDEKQKKTEWKKPTEVFGKKDSLDKKTLVLINTDWCNSCRVMKRTSFSDSASEAYLKEKFELVDMNPESTEPVVYKGKTYTNPKTPQVPFHQLAAVLGRNNVVLPSLVVLNEKQEIVDVIPSYLGPQLLSDVAIFYGDNVYKSKSWEDFMKGQNNKRLAH